MKQTSQPREDLRQRRTRKLLADALLSLLEERPLSEISVVDICQRAMVHRTTFYAHFDDKLALLRYAVDELQKYFEPVDPSLVCDSSHTRSNGLGCLSADAQITQRLVHIQLHTFPLLFLLLLLLPCSASFPTNQYGLN